MLSGIGIRGFRPQISGINKRSLLLIDGRPSGVTNLATLLLDNVERDRGAEGRRVGGVRIVGDGRRRQRDHAAVARQDRRQPARWAAAASARPKSPAAPAAASRQPCRLRRRRAAPSISATTSAWATASMRPATSYKTYDGSGRVWCRPRATAGASTAASNCYRGRDIMTPGDLVSGNSAGQQGRRACIAGRARSPVASAATT